MIDDPFDVGTLAHDLRAAGYPPATAVMIGVRSAGRPDMVAVQGVVPGGAPFGPDSIVYVGSLAKQMTAACAALLVRAGQLDIDAPIRAWLPELPAWAQDMRVRHLIHHTADLPDEATVQDVMHRRGVRDRTSPGVLAALASVATHAAQPGKRYAYANCGYVCLAVIVERVTSCALTAFAHKHLFTPLGMSRTCYLGRACAHATWVGRPGTFAQSSPALTR